MYCEKEKDGHVRQKYRGLLCTAFVEAKSSIFLVIVVGQFGNSTKGLSWYWNIEAWKLVDRRTTKLKWTNWVSFPSRRETSSWYYWQRQPTPTNGLVVALSEEKSSMILRCRFAKAQQHSHESRRKAQRNMRVAWRQKSKNATSDRCTDQSIK